MQNIAHFHIRGAQFIIGPAAMLLGLTDLRTISFCKLQK